VLERRDRFADAASGNMIQAFAKRARSRRIRNFGVGGESGGCGHERRVLAVDTLQP
jgi:hypothetical protein